MKMRALRDQIASVGRRQAYRNALREYRHRVEVVTRLYANHRHTVPKDQQYLWQSDEALALRVAESARSEAFDIIVGVLDIAAAGVN